MGFSQKYRNAKAGLRHIVECAPPKLSDGKSRRARIYLILSHILRQNGVHGSFNYPLAVRAYIRAHHSLPGEHHTADQTNPEVFLVIH